MLINVGKSDVVRDQCLVYTTRQQAQTDTRGRIVMISHNRLVTTDWSKQIGQKIGQNRLVTTDWSQQIGHNDRVM
jgi:hypothetical protein